jgi:diadenosine tetraphosphatase ApaH/serine/threonine PP2A family protein phosphatase
MKRAVISDIHGNLEALTAVLADIDRRGVEEILCLGDLVGYGPDPQAVTDLVRGRCVFSLRGNHDWALFHEPVGFNPVARGAITCIREWLRPRYDSMLRDEERWRFLKTLPEEERRDDALFVHASPRNRIFEYLMPGDVHPARREKLEANFARVDRLCFVGHTHYPGVFTDDMTFRRPEDLGGGTVELGAGKAIVNDGSVGQPRDRDPRACYVEWEDNRITWRRVAYDVKRTMAKIRDVGCLHHTCADRLALGR